MNASYVRKLNFLLVAIITCALVAALSGLVVVSVGLAQRYIVPEVEAKAVTQGQALATLVARPLSYGIDLQALVGVDALFSEVIKGNPEFGFLAISDSRGGILFSVGEPLAEAAAHIVKPALLPEVAKVVESGARPGAVHLGSHHVVSLPIYSADHTPTGLLHIGVRASYVRNILNELLLDLGVILIVSLFVAVEVLYFISGGKLSGQYEMITNTLRAVANNDFTKRLHGVGRDELGRVAFLINAAIGKINDTYGRLSGASAATASSLSSARFEVASSEGTSETYTNFLGRLRAPLFLSLIAEDLSRSFIPIYAKQLYKPVPGISAEFIQSLPIMLFMMLVALLQPVLAGWSERVGRKHSLVTGILLGCVAFVMTANAFTVYDLLVWRALSGVSWAIVFVAAQGFILDKATAETRTRDIAFFVGVIMVASLCGPPIGGILADNIGFRATFYVSAALSLLGAILMLRYLPGDQLLPNAVVRKLRMKEIIAVLSNRRFLLLVGSAGIPAKMILISFCFYLIPLYITNLGDSSAMTGRVLMLYAVMMVFGVPLAARISDRMRKRKEFVGFGLILSGISGLFVLLGENVFIAIAITVVLGVAQAISIAPQTAYVSDICADDIEKLGEGTVYGVYRLMERIGNSLGPPIAAVLLNYFGFRGAFSAIGGFLLLGGIAFIFAFRQSDTAPIATAVVNGMEQ